MVLELVNHKLRRRSRRGWAMSCRSRACAPSAPTCLL